jgi:hypothetical protein
VVLKVPSKSNATAEIQRNAIFATDGNQMHTDEELLN